jgi:hypothetical protein
MLTMPVRSTRDGTFIYRPAPAKARPARREKNIVLGSLRAGVTRKRSGTFVVLRARLSRIGSANVYWGDNRISRKEPSVR